MDNSMYRQSRGQLLTYQTKGFIQTLPYIFALIKPSNAMQVYKSYLQGGISYKKSNIVYRRE